MLLDPYKRLKERHTMSAIAAAERARTAIELGESHFREFKSALEGRPEEKRKRPVKEIATNIAQTLVAFANADGGELLVGVEDSGEITGLLGFDESEIETLKNSPEARIHADTPLRIVRKMILQLDEKPVLYFSVPKSTEYVHITSDGRCLQRQDLASVPVSHEAIKFDRWEKKSREYDREFVDGVTADDLDITLVKVVADQIMKGMSPEKCLQYLDLGEYGLSQLRLRRAALLLFGRIPSKWHPRLQIRIMKVDGDTLKTGEEYNVISDELIAGNILTLVERAWDALRPHLTQTRFDKNARFEQVSIYPELACREALLNAVAHRDYSDEGRGIEVFIYSEHLEVKNPGGLLSSISIEEISNQSGVHQSRNAHIARVLRELGYMRELGEGMRRIFNLMNRNELAPPSLNSTSDGFSITLTHKPIYSSKDLLWLSNFEQFNLNREQKAVVLLGADDKTFSAQNVWDAVGIVDTEHYRILVDSLQRLRILFGKLDRESAQRTARQRRIPFREFPRYGIQVPSASASREERAEAYSKNAGDSAAEDSPDEGKRIFVANLGQDISQEILFQKFSEFGEIASIKVPKLNGRGRGFAFVEYAVSDGAKAALAADRVAIDERVLVLRPAQPRR